MKQETKQVHRVWLARSVATARSPGWCSFHYCFRGQIVGNLDAGYPAAAPFAIHGYLGVDLFFLISGS
jgi:peptidoglycan/LPS O-acetylase OafA/YrhL